MEVHTIHFESVDSTNNWLKAHAKSLDPQKITCLIADVQTAGRGCYARQWISKKGNLQMSLFFSMKLENPLLPHAAQLLTFSAAQILKAEQVPIQIKWPNDLLIDGKKLCGVLAETIQLDGQLGVIIGLGMNVNASVQADQPTTSLIEATGRNWDLNDLSAKIIAQFQKDLLLDLPTFQERFKALISGTTIKSG